MRKWWPEIYIIAFLIAFILAVGYRIAYGQGYIDSPPRIDYPHWPAVADCDPCDEDYSYRVKAIEFKKGDTVIRATKIEYKNEALTHYSMTLIYNEKTPNIMVLDYSVVEDHEKEELRGTQSSVVQGQYSGIGVLRKAQCKLVIYQVEFLLGDEEWILKK